MKEDKILFYQGYIYIIHNFFVRLSLTLHNSKKETVVNNTNLSSRSPVGNVSTPLTDMKRDKISSCQMYVCITYNVLCTTFNQIMQISNHFSPMETVSLQGVNSERVIFAFLQVFANCNHNLTSLSYQMICFKNTNDWENHL